MTLFFISLAVFVTLMLLWMMFSPSEKPYEGNIEYTYKDSIFLRRDVIQFPPKNYHLKHDSWHFMKFFRSDYESLIERIRQFTFRRDLYQFPLKHGDYAQFFSGKVLVVIEDKPDKLKHEHYRDDVYQSFVSFMMCEYDRRNVFYKSEIADKYSQQTLRDFAKNEIKIHVCKLLSGYSMIVKQAKHM